MARHAARCVRVVGRCLRILGDRRSTPAAHRPDPQPVDAPEPQQVAGDELEFVVHGGGRDLQIGAGERVVVTRDGRPVAELTAVRTARLGSAALLARWRHLPRVDLETLRRDLDDVLDADA